MAEKGLDAPLVVEALEHHEKLLKLIEDAMGTGKYIAGDTYSIADVAATPYVWRLEQLRLSKMWDKRPGVAAWYERIRQRASFDAAISKVVTQEDFERYRNFEPDPWPKVREILGVA